MLGAYYTSLGGVGVVLPAPPPPPERGGGLVLDPCKIDVREELSVALSTHSSRVLATAYLST